MENIREQFPILKQHIYGHPLVYLDNAATTQKPQSVIDTIVEYYSRYNSNVHRGVHYLSQQATDREEAARSKVADFIKAASPDEIIFTKGTTDSINLLADSLGFSLLQEGDEIILTEMEHHSNIVPWQIIAERRGLVLKFIPLSQSGGLDLDVLDELVSARTRIISLTWVSNTLGTVNDIRSVIGRARRHDIMVVVDGAQAVQHFPVDVVEMDIDFLVASGHKMYGPTGIGFLYGKKKILDRMMPYQGGGSMIKTVTTKGFTPHDVPFRFEAGTPHIEGIIGLGAAVDFIRETGMHEIREHESGLMSYAESLFSGIRGVHILGREVEKSGALSMVFDHCHPADVGEIIDKKGIAVRVGQHCCQPIMDYFDISGTLRISFAVYTERSDIEKAAQYIEKAVDMLS